MRRFLARLNISCNLIGKMPAIPYWPYCQTLWRMGRDSGSSFKG